MDITEFLHLRGADLASVVATVQAAVRLEADDVLLAVGSVAEGLGNSKSDLDLLLITPRDPGALPARDELGLMAGRCLIDVRIMHASEVDQLLGRLRAITTLPWDVTNAVKLTIDERTLLHRLLHGYPLVEARGAQRTAVMPSAAELSRLKLQVARQEARTVQVDLVGYRETGDHRTLVFAAQHLLGQAVDALTASYQLTHPVAKWRYRMLDRLPADWELALAVRASNLAAGQRYWCLHRAPEQPDDKPALDHALRISAFARAAFVSAENRLVKPAFPGHRLAAAPAAARASGDPALPYLDFDVDFFLGERSATLGRLNEFGDTVELSPSGLAVALLCDGATTVREAAVMVHGRDDAAAASAVRDTIAHLAGAGFCLPAAGA
ncbi:MAG TPA: hypothetical protein VGD37_19895 [Kofleriaceae bacterium]|jgi:hypothetical protein